MKHSTLKRARKTVPAKKLKVAMLLDASLDPNDGVQQYVLSVSQWLVGQGHEVHYLVGETTDRQLPNIHSLSKNISVTFNGNRVSTPLWVRRKKVRQLLAEQQFDVIHVQTPHHPLMAQRVITEAATDTAVVGTFHILPYGWLAKVGNKLLGIALRPSLKRIDQMLAVSSSAAVFEKWSFGKEAIVLPNVFDYDRFMEAVPFERYADDTINILFLGRLVERKGCKYLLEAIAKLDRTVLPKFRVIICGRGRLLEELQDFAQEHGIEDIVEFTGFVTEEDKPRYYASADISVFPSTAGESFGIVLLEAMASGNAAVLAGDNPGYATVMEPRPELLFNPSHTEDLTTMLERLLTDKTRRKEVAGWGKPYAKAFDVQVVGPQLVQQYENIIAKRRTEQDNNK